MLTRRCIRARRSLFLDEPTSGLDSAIAAEVMQSIKELQLSTGCTLLVTIHQPSPGARRGMLRCGMAA